MAAASAPPALLVVDMISLFDFPGAGRMGLLPAARGIQALRRRFHAEGWPVVYANDNFARWLCGFDDLVGMAAAAGGMAREVVGLLAPAAQDYQVLKPKHSAFLATPLAVLLAKLGVRRLLVTGMALESCVLATAIEANARELEVVVSRDAVAGRPELRAAAFKVLSGSRAARVLGNRAALAWAGPAHRRR